MSILSQHVIAALQCAVPLFGVAFGWHTTSTSQTLPCSAPTALLRLDHAIVVVHDLDSASVLFRALGFRLKSGRSLSNGLLNRHIKFRDRGELELMTLTGTPSDAVARNYAQLLASGERGAYAALQTDSMTTVRERATKLGLPIHSTRLGPWEFVSLSDEKDAGAVFVRAGGPHVEDPDSVLDHENGAIGLEAAWIEAGPLLEHFLTACGSKKCETSRLPDGREGIRWALGSGSLVTVPVAGTTTPRLIGVELRRSTLERNRIIEQVIPGFWILLR